MNDGLSLKGFRLLNKLTQAQLARKLKISVAVLSRMEKQEIPIDEKTAKKLGKLFDIDYKVFIDPKQNNKQN